LTIMASSAIVNPVFVEGKVEAKLGDV
jgi:hypothetical protein